MKQFDYYEPSALDEACTLLMNPNGRAKVLAGGTDLIVQLKEKQIDIDCVINLKKIKGLSEVTFDEEKGLRIGALVTWTQILDCEPVKKHYPILMSAAETMASTQVRNVATLAGNVCHASPAANGSIPLLLYEAECTVQGPNGKRSFPIHEMFKDVQKNSLRKGEILTDISTSLPFPGTKGTYYKFAPRKAMDLASVVVGALVRVNNGTFHKIRIALGAVAPVPFRARRAEGVLAGQAVTDEIIRKAAETAAIESAPISDIRASKEYRVEIIKELTFRAIKECAV